MAFGIPCVLLPAPGPKAKAKLAAMVKAGKAPAVANIPPTPKAAVGVAKAVAAAVAGAGPLGIPAGPPPATPGKLASSSSCRARVAQRPRRTREGCGRVELHAAQRQHTA